VLIVDIDAITAEVNNSELITTGFEFDAWQIDPLTAFHAFYA